MLGFVVVDIVDNCDTVDFDVVLADNSVDDCGNNDDYYYYYYY